MLSTGATFAQNLVACVVIAYVVFTFLFGYGSLRARRSAAGNATGAAVPDGRLDSMKSGRLAHFAGIIGAFLLPAGLLVMLLSLAGRERSGEVETNNVFVVAYRPEASIAQLASVSRVSKGDIVARFSSDALEHRLAALQARHLELLANRDALKTATLPQSSEIMMRIQTQEQRLAKTEQRAAELERALFSASHQLVAAMAAWQRTRNELVVQQPMLQQMRASHAAEHELAARNHERYAVLHDKGFTSTMRLDQHATAKQVAWNRLIASGEALQGARGAITSLDKGYRDTETLIREQIARLRTELDDSRIQLPAVRAAYAAAGEALVRNEATARTQRQHELAAASARIRELDSQIAAVLAQAEVKSPISGRVLYRNATASRLTGTMPVLVVAAEHGFLMRLDLPRDELPALRQTMSDGNEFEVLIDDTTGKHLVQGSVVRIDDSGLDPKRVTVVFGLDVPEPTLVRMALKGVTPRAHLRWQPPMLSVIETRIAQAIGVDAQRGPVATAAKGDRRPVPVKATNSAEFDSATQL